MAATKTDPRGNATIETRNILGQLYQVEDSKGGLLTYTYDAQGRIFRTIQIIDDTACNRTELLCFRLTEL
ncbi:MAG: hypothetical protein HRT35_33850 [Algicola sp.]|nr:hypothetical protein [Algicola sp.]